MDKKIANTFSPINFTDRTPAPSEPKKRRFGFKRVATLLGFIVVITIAGTMLYGFLNNDGEDSTRNQVKSAFSSDEMKDYSSPENKFTIKMPGFPSIKQSSYQDGGKDIKVTSYQRLIEDNSKLYTFEVHDYSGLEFDEKKALEAKLNSTIQNTEGARLENSQLGTYSGMNAIEGTYKLPKKDGGESESHIRFIIKDSKIYAVILTGADQAKFDEFANSLRLS